MPPRGSVESFSLGLKTWRSDSNPAGLCSLTLLGVLSQKGSLILSLEREPSVLDSQESVVVAPDPLL
jgi:hypothetical protein